MDTAQLIAELKMAQALAAEFRGGYSERFDDAADFALALQQAIEQLESGDASVLPRLNLWFLPTSDWDALVGTDGMALGQRISDRLLAFVGPARPVI